MKEGFFAIQGYGPSAGVWGLYGPAQESGWPAPLLPASSILSLGAVLRRFGIKMQLPNGPGGELLVDWPDGEKEVISPEEIEHSGNRWFYPMVSKAQLCWEKLSLD